MTNPSYKDSPARWHERTLDAWRALREARAERDAFRELAQQAIHALHELTKKHERQSERYHALLNERRDQQQRAA